MLGVRRQWVALLLVLGLLPAAAAQADIVTLDLEGQAASTNTTSTTFSSGGVTAVLDLDTGGTFQYQNISSFTSLGMPASWKSRSLFGSGDNRFVVNLGGSDVFGVSVEVGDLGIDADDVYLEVYGGQDGGGSLLGSDSGLLPDTGAVFVFTGDTLSYSGAAAIGSFVFWGVGSNNQSVYFDNITLDTTAVAVVPLPLAGWIGLGLLGGLGTLARRRRRRG